jgi:glycosyltransferase involved in cell wall biosynthesis
MKKRIAIWTPGAVGGGYYSQGFPFIVKLLENLSSHYDLDVYSVATPNQDFKPVGYRIFAPPGFLKFPYLLTRFLRNHFRYPYDMVFSFWGYPTGLVAVLLGKLIGKPSVVNVLGGESANLPEIKYGHLQKPLTRRLVIWTCDHATTLLALTRYQINVLQQHGLRRDGTIIPWGADQTLFGFSNKKIGDQLHIIHVANLTEVKDQETLIRAFDIIRKKKNARLRIVGPDFLNGKIQGLVSKLGLDDYVDFTGPQPYGTMASHFEWAHVFMLTSLSEGQNNSLLEGALCGVLMAGTRVGIIDDLGPTHAIGVDRKDFNALAMQVLETVDDEGKRERMIAHALQWATAHDFTWTVNQTLKVLEETFKRK